MGATWSMTMIDLAINTAATEKAGFGNLPPYSNQAKELEALGADIIQSDEPAGVCIFDEVNDWGNCGTRTCYRRVEM